MPATTSTAGRGPTSSRRSAGSPCAIPRSDSSSPTAPSRRRRRPRSPRAVSRPRLTECRAMALSDAVAAGAAAPALFGTSRHTSRSHAARTVGLGSPRRHSRAGRNAWRSPVRQLHAELSGRGQRGGRGGPIDARKSSTSASAAPTCSELVLEPARRRLPSRRRLRAARREAPRGLARQLREAAIQGPARPLERPQPLVALREREQTDAVRRARPPASAPGLGDASRATPRARACARGCGPA